MKTVENFPEHIVKINQIVKIKRKAFGKPFVGFGEVYVQDGEISCKVSQTVCHVMEDGAFQPDDVQDSLGFYMPDNVRNVDPSKHLIEQATALINGSETDTECDVIIGSRSKTVLWKSIGVEFFNDKIKVEYFGEERYIDHQNVKSGYGMRYF